MTCKDCLHYGVCSGYLPSDLDKDVFDLCAKGLWDEIPDIDERCSDFKDRSRYVVREKGEWVAGERCNHKPCRIKNPEKWVIYKCSVCGYSNGRKRNDFCPNCGADMRKEENNG